MNGRKTRKHKTILMMRIFSYDLFKLFDFSGFTPFSTSYYTRRSDALAINCPFFFFWF